MVQEREREEKRREKREERESSDVTIRLWDSHQKGVKREACASKGRVACDKAEDKEGVERGEDDERTHN